MQRGIDFFLEMLLMLALAAPSVRGSRGESVRGSPRRVCCVFFFAPGAGLRPNNARDAAWPARRKA